MSSPQVDSTDNRQPVTAEVSETNTLTTSVMNRTHWMQRVLSPWVQRWLSTGDAGEAAIQASGRHRFTSLTGADTQHTLARLRIQYEAHSNLATPADSGSLPLAGAIEKETPSPVAESVVPISSQRAHGLYSKPFQSLEDFTRAVEAAKARNYAPLPEEAPPQPAPRREQGPYSKPFKSLEDFMEAVEAAKERNYAPPPAEAQTQQTTSREPGPYSKPFQSIDDFMEAVEAAKERNYVPPSEEELNRPAPQHEPGPYSKPFESLEDFVQAVEAAQERNYAPPPPVEAQTPPPKAGKGKYSRAFSSLADFVKALEETGNQSGQVAADMPAAETTEPSVSAESPSILSKPTRVRPISRVEELPARAETKPVSVPVDLPAPPETIPPAPQPQAAAESAPTAKPTAAVKPSRTQAPPKAAPSARSSAASVGPQVQRSSREASPDLNLPEDEEEPVVQRRVSPTLQQREAPVQSEPEDLTVSESVEPSVTPELDEVVQRLSQPATPPASRPVDRPLVQRQTTAHEEPEEIALDEEGPIEPEQPTVQRQTVVVQRQSAEDFATPSAESAEPSDQTEEPIVQRQIISPVQPKSTPSSTQPDMPLVQRHAAVDEPAPEETEESSAPVVQRSVEAGAPAAPAPGQLPAALERPLVQRQATAPPESADEIDEPEETVQRSVEASAPAPTSVQLPAALEMPLVQRQAAAPPESADEIDESEETVQRSVEASVPAPRPAAAAPQLVQPGEKKTVAPLTDSQLPPARVEMPLVQRQTAEAELEPPDLGAVETTPAAETVSADEVVPLEDTDTTETVQRKATTARTLPRKAVPPVVKPVPSRVQRHAAEFPEPLGDEAQAIPSAPADTHAPLDMPFVQRQPLEGNPTVVQRSVVTGESETEAATAQPAFDLSERILSRVAPPERRAVAKPVELTLHHAPIQRESLPETTAADHVVQHEPAPVSRPVESSASMASAAPFAVQRTAEPVIQRTPAESATSSPGVGFIQRVESVPAATEKAAEAAAETPVDLDNLARQVYPIIKRLIAVERERRAFR